jgi:hypothetical protein
MSGFTGTPFEEYYVLPAPVTKNTYTTQAVISAAGTTSTPRCLIPANFFASIGKSLHARARFTIANTAAATFVLAAGLDSTAGTIAGTGGTTLFTSAALTPTAATTCVADLDFDITAQAVGNLGTTLQLNGKCLVSSVASSGAWNSTAQAAFFSNNLTGLNNEISLFLELFGTWSASNAANTTTLQQFKVYGEN